MKKIFLIVIFSGILISFLLVSDSALAIRPGPFELVNPSNGADDVLLYTTFSWYESADAETYNLYLNGALWKRDLPDNFYGIQAGELFEPGTTYSWYVRACNTDGDGCRSSDERWSFTTVTDGPPEVWLSPNKSQAESGELISFAVVAEDNNAVIALYIDFGDGEGWEEGYACSGGSTCLNSWSHSYSAAGTYVVRALARDNLRQETEKQRTITIGGGGSRLPSNGTTGGGIDNPLDYETFGELASAINKFIFIIALALAPILFAIGGVMIVTAGSNPLQVQKAQKLMLYTAIGLVVILLAQAIVHVIKNVIGVKEEITYFPMIFSGLITSFRNLKFKRSK